MPRLQHVALSMVLTCGISSPAWAEDASPDARLLLGGVGSNLDGGGELRLWVDLNRQVRLGLRGRGLAVRQTYIAGFEETEGWAAEALPFVSVRVARLGTAELRLRLGIGARQSGVTTDRSDDSSLRLLTEFGPMIEWQLDPAVMLRVGWIQRTDLEMSPTTDVAVLGEVFRVGANVRLAERWSLYGEAEFGGVFGYGGDNEKIQARGAFGVMVALDPPMSPQAPADRNRAPTIGGFVTLEWRALALAGHLSHGPGLSAGITLWDGRLRVGLAGFGRPGPINPETFDVTPAGGQTYKGQEQISLRSDGAFFGLLLESEWPVPGAPQWRVIPSVTVGNAGFGFYLTGDDRETPDGRRVSAWEDELQDGKDAGVALGIEPGVRIAWRPDGSPVGPYVAARYLFLIDYDAFANDSYNGFSFAAGAEFVF